MIWAILVPLAAIVVLLWEIRDRLKAICRRLDAFTDDDNAEASRDLLKALNK